ncbi:MAG TPA: DUF1080 domain-containing protein [Prolixibacteraceae bacterium]|nr:DUF1080 domain-containing protein [Prolixibacteraceae bacterium]
MLRKISLTGALMLLLSIPNISKAVDSAKPFLGRWALFLPGGAGWLEVKQMDTYLEGSLLWYGGSVEPVSNVYMEGETLVVTKTRNYVRTPGSAGAPARTHVATTQFRFSMYADQLVGEQITPEKDGNSSSMRFTGKKIPDVPAAPDLSKLVYGKPVKLLNGKDLSGWKLLEEKKTNGWSVVDGILVNDPVQKEGQPHIQYGNLCTVDKYEDFNLKLQVNIPAGSNSGVYLRGIYEIQVVDSYGKALDSHNMGGLYSRITPSESAEKPAGEWQDMDITLCDRHVTVILNGKTIINNQPVLGCTGGAITACEFIPGPIYLQGDHGKVLYRNIEIKPVLKK